VLGELQDVFDSPAFEDFGWARIRGFDHNGSGLVVRLKIGFDDETVPSQNWQVRCSQVRGYRFTEAPVSSLQLASDHPLLLPFTEPHVQLSFRGQAPVPMAAVGTLWNTHEQATEGWIQLPHFLNPNLPLLQLIASGSGILAEGPRLLLDQYAKALEPHGLEFTRVGERAPKRWEGGRWQAEPSGLEVLLFGDSFVIGQGFTAERDLSPVAA